MRLDATYKHRGREFRRSPEDPSQWEILNIDRSVMRSVSKGALCRQIIDALLDGREPPVDPGKRPRCRAGALSVANSVSGSVATSSRWIAVEKPTHSIPKEELERVSAIVEERTALASEVSAVAGKKLTIIDLTDLPPDVLRAIDE